MTWTQYALLTSVALACADLCIKVAAGKITNSLGLLIYGSCTFLAGLGWVLLQRSQGVTLTAAPLGALAAVGVGVSFSAVTIGLYLSFAAGAPVSVVSPLVRLGGLLIAGGVGILVFREPFTMRYALGLALAVCGVYLILTR